MKINKLVVLITTILVTLMGSLIYNLFFIDFVHPVLIRENANGKFESAPFPPSLEYPFGTDRAGNNMLLRLLSGFSFTFLFIVGISISRMVLGLCFSYLLIFKLKNFSSWILFYFKPFQHIPTFIIIIIFMVNIFQYNLNLWEIVTIQFFCILLLGLPPILITLTNELKSEMKKDYITSSYTLGASNTRIFISHLIPNLRPKLIVLTLQQVSITLVLLLHLGLFQYYIGGKKSEAVDFEGQRFLSLTGEWGGILGESKNDILTAPWLFSSPLIVSILLLITISTISKEFKS